MTASTPATPDARLETIRQLLDSLTETDLFPLADNAEAALASLAAELAATRQALEIILTADPSFLTDERTMAWWRNVTAVAGRGLARPAARAVLAGEDTT